MTLLGLTYQQIMKYRPLTQLQRDQIMAYLETVASQRDFATQIGVHSRTVSRDIRRNGDSGHYNLQQAQAISDRHRHTV